MTSPYVAGSTDDPIMLEPVVVDGITYRALVVKIIHGVPGSVDGDASSATPLPVTGSGGGGGGGVVINRGLLTDHSGTIATGGTQQQILAADANRAYLLIQNLATDPLYIDFGVNAVIGSPSLKLNTNDILLFEDSFIPTQAVHAIGATTGNKFICKTATVASTIINQGPLTNRSGTIGTGGLGQDLAPANPLRQYLIIQNPDVSLNLYVDFGTAAVNDSPSITIPPGRQFVMESSFLCTQLVSITGDSTGQVFVAKEG